MLNWCFEAPIVSYGVVYNLMSSGSGASVTVSGLNFGVSNTTPTSTMAGWGACMTTSWTSSTSVSCLSSSMNAPYSGAYVTVSSVIGTKTSSLFSFDGNSFFYTISFAHFSFSFNWIYWLVRCQIHIDVCTSASTVSYAMGMANQPSSGGASLTLMGLNFAATDSTITVAVGGWNVCMTSTWTSSSSMICWSSGTVAPQTGAFVTMAGVVGTRTSKIFTLDCKYLCLIIFHFYIFNWLSSSIDVVGSTCCVV